MGRPRLAILYSIAELPYLDVPTIEQQKEASQALLAAVWLLYRTTSRCDHSRPYAILRKMIEDMGRKRNLPIFGWRISQRLLQRRTWFSLACGLVPRAATTTSPVADSVAMHRLSHTFPEADQRLVVSGRMSRREHIG